MTPELWILSGEEEIPAGRGLSIRRDDLRAFLHGDYEVQKKYPELMGAGFFTAVANIAKKVVNVPGAIVKGVQTRKARQEQAAASKASNALDFQKLQVEAAKNKQKIIIVSIVAAGAVAAGYFLTRKTKK